MATSSRRRFLLLGGCLLLSAGGLWVLVSQTQYPYAPLPTYPHATQIRIWEEDVAALPHNEARGKQRTIIFQTHDSVEAIQEYYQTELTRYGWIFTEHQTSADNALRFQWNNGLLQHQQALIISVYTNDGQQSTVNIVQRPSLGLLW
jgi:hypothetical protein